MEKKELHVRLNSVGCKNMGKSWTDGVHDKIEKIIIGSSGSFVTSIRAVYGDPDGSKVLGPEHGGKSLTSLKVITVTDPITRIEGTFCLNSEGNSGITSLDFSSSSGSYGSIGAKNGESFIFESDSGFSGFHGRATDDQVCALGVYINTSAKQHLVPCKPSRSTR